VSLGREFRGGGGGGAMEKALSPYWWWGPICRWPEHQQVGDRSPPLPLSERCPRHLHRWGLSSRRGNTPLQDWSSAARTHRSVHRSYIEEDGPVRTRDSPPVSAGSSGCTALHSSPSVGSAPRLCAAPGGRRTCFRCRTALKWLSSPLWYALWERERTATQLALSRILDEQWSSRGACCRYTTGTTDVPLAAASHRLPALSARWRKQGTTCHNVYCVETSWGSYFGTPGSPTCRFG